MPIQQCPVFGKTAKHVPRRPARSCAASALILTVIALAGCSSLENQGVITGEPNIFPANYRPEIVAFLRTYLNDPTRIRSALIAEPALKPAGNEQRYAVCLQFSARKANGEYEGSKDRIVFFLAGKLDAMVEAKKEQCGNAAYQPFPELERLMR